MSGFLSNSGGGGSGGGSGSTAISSLTNGTASNSLTISSNTQTWNSAPSADGMRGFVFSENIAASGGTYGNQVLVSSITKAASTQTNLDIEQDGPSSSVPGLLVGGHTTGATSPAFMGMRFSRGTLAAPTTAVNGDLISWISGRTYVGPTNGYIETSRIETKVNSAVTDSATGAQAQMSFYGMASNGLQEVLRLIPKTGVFTNGQILGPDGTTFGPAYSFFNDSGSGWYRAGANDFRFYSGPSAANVLQCTGGQVIVSGIGSAATPILTLSGLTTTGFFGAGAGNLNVGLASNGVEEWQVGGSTMQFSKGSADAVAYALNIRKSRGTVAAPTVITSGDNLLTENGYGYVGATNTYRQATAITHTSTGTISDATTGIGGIIKFSTTLAGTDTVVQENMRIFNGSSTNISMATTNSHATLTVGGGLSVSTASVNTSTTLNTTHAFVLASTAGATITIVLPTATNNGQLISVKRTSAGLNAVTVQAQAGDLIEGVASVSLAAQWAEVTMWADGQSQWYKMSTI